MQLKQKADAYFELLYEKIPVRSRLYWQRKIKKLYHDQYVEREQQLENRTKKFMITQLKILVVGLFISFILAAVFLCFGFLEKNDVLVFQRNPFGNGSSQTMIDIKNAQDSTTVTLEIAEQSITKEELEKLYAKFFKELETIMKGKNKNLQNVNQRLELPDKLSEFPFFIEYEIKNPEYIRYDGNLGEEAKKLKQGTLKTQIIITAAYKDYTDTKTYLIGIVPKKKKVEPFEAVKKYIKEEERKSRKEEYMTLAASKDGNDIHVNGKQNPFLFIWLGCIVGMIGIFWHRYSQLKEKSQQSREEIMNDFPLIVHMLTLYMGAGLSFSRAVSRITEDYQKQMIVRENHYAFEQLFQLEQKIQMGMSQREACENWANSMGNTYYQKLSMLLIQGMSKGSRELRTFLSQMEQEAFRTHIDRVRKRGEQASTKMLVPMVLLMTVIMMIVMFPAMIQFSNF